MNEDDTVSQGAIDGYKESRFETAGQEVPTPSPLKASNTLESLKPREVLGYKVIDMPIPTQVTFNESSPSVVRPEPVFISGFTSDDAVRKTDNKGYVESPANVLPVDWPAAMESMKPRPALLPSVYDRVVKLEEQLDALLDRIALHNVRSNHKI